MNYKRTYAALLRSTAKSLRAEADACDREAKALEQPRVKYTLTVYKDTTFRAPRDIVEAEFAAKLGGNANVIVEDYEEL